jgi:hypothetical protein
MGKKPLCKPEPVDLIDEEKPCVRGVITSLHDGLADEFDQVIVNHIPIGIGRIALDSANPPDNSHVESSFLKNLTNNRVLRRFTRFDAAARQ